MQFSASSEAGLLKCSRLELSTSDLSGTAAPVNVWCTRQSLMSLEEDRAQHARAQRSGEKGRRDRPPSRIALASARKKLLEFERVEWESITLLCHFHHSLRHPATRICSIRY
mmetsp:Transcript_11381/g.23025  ORF Transcript_11381/g.23025 Transcript_11381/m.23025 type:complete len:112 (-) Transcript_11381:82-417(-)